MGFSISTIPSFIAANCTASEVSNFCFSTHSSGSVASTAHSLSHFESTFTGFSISIIPSLITAIQTPGSPSPISKYTLSQTQTTTQKHTQTQIYSENEQTIN
uniref:Putative ovule protein n=1 Tax=Solanum chacoense TaxID=4108 RepID=A0A0V0GJ41_SOLCH